MASRIKDMARTFNPIFADILSDAFSRAEIRPQTATQEHLDEALRSANYLLTEFTNRGVNQYQLIEQVIPTVSGIATYDLVVGTVDAFHVVYRRDNADVPIWSFSRSDYHSLPNKNAAGRPTEYFTERGKEGNATRTITVWPVPDRSNDEIRLWVWVRANAQDSLAAEAPIAVEFADAFADGLALRLAKKFNRLKVRDLTSDYMTSFLLAQSTGRERAPLRLRMRGYTKGRGR